LSKEIRYVILAIKVIEHYNKSTQRRLHGQKRIPKGAPAWSARLRAAMCDEAADQGESRQHREEPSFKTSVRLGDCVSSIATSGSRARRLRGSRIKTRDRDGEGLAAGGRFHAGAAEDATETRSANGRRSRNCENPWRAGGAVDRSRRDGACPSQQRGRRKRQAAVFYRKFESEDQAVKKTKCEPATATGPPARDPGDRQ